MKNNISIVIILVISSCVRFILGALVPAGFDESYYYIFGQFPAWGYFDHPPIVGAVSWLNTQLSFGLPGALPLRWLPILIFTMTSYLLYLIVYPSFGKKTALAVILIFNSTPYFLLAGGAMLLPDNALLMFWLLFVYALNRLHQDAGIQFVFLAGLAAGLALLSKYHAVLLFPGLWLLPVLMKKWRSPRYLVYILIISAIALVVFLPNIIWNARHDWISYIYQFGKGTDSSKGVSITLLIQAIATQAAYLSPWIFSLLLISLIKTVKDDHQLVRLSLPFTLLPVILFTVIGSYRTILPHWPMPGYLSAFIILAAGLHKLREKTVHFGSIFSPVAMAILIAIIMAQVFTGLLPLNPKNDPTVDGFGWGELAAQIEKKGYINNDRDFLFTHKWFLSGALYYALRDEKNIVVLNRNAPHNFIFWLDHRNFEAGDGYLITSSRFNINPHEYFGKYFKSISAVDSLTITRMNKPVKQFKIWKCENYNGQYPFAYGPKQE